MTQSDEKDLEIERDERLPWWEWIILPMLSLLTICILSGSTETMSRRMFKESEAGSKRCLAFNDSLTGAQGIPNCVSWRKDFESQTVEYRFNSSGYRSDVDFGPKLRGTYRIVVVGSSVAMGGGVQRKDSFAALLPAELTKATGRTVELYDEAFPGNPGLPQNVDLRFKDALGAKPDMVLWVLTRWDIKEILSGLAGPPAPVEQRAIPGVKWRQVDRDLARHAFRDASFDLLGLLRGLAVSARQPFSDSRSVFFLRHFLYGSQSQFVKFSLAGPDDIVGFLRAEPSEAWKSRLRQFDSYAADIAEQSRAAGITLAVVLVPSRVEVDMVSMGKWPAGFDPFKLDNELHSIVVSHGGTYINVYPDLPGLSDPKQYFFPVDGHPNAAGHAVISSLLYKGLTTGAIPALSPAGMTRIQATPEQAK